MASVKVNTAMAGIHRRSGNWGALAVFFCLLAAAQAWAEVKVSAKVSPNPVSINQVTNLTITVENGNLEALPEPNLPAPMGLAGGPSTSQSINIINGEQTATTQVAWPIASPKEGVMTIPPINVQVSGKVYTTRALRVEFTPASTAPKPDTNGLSNLDSILQLQIGKTEFYQGEVVPITATLYVPIMVQLLRTGLIEVEKSDFAVQRFPQAGDQSMEMLGRVRYRSFTYHSTLSALKAGKTTVGPAKMEIIVEVPTGNTSNPFGFIQTQRQKVVVQGTEIPVEVLAMPAEGRPPGFSGAVGDFTLKATTATHEAMVGDPVSVDLLVEGQGNFDALDAPKLTQTEGWKLYPPKRYNVDNSDPNTVDLLHRGVGFSTILVPEKVLPAVPPFEFTFFNPKDKKYVTLRSSPIEMVIKPSDKVAPPMMTDVSTSTSAPKPSATPAPAADITDILVRIPTTPHWAVASIPLMEDGRFKMVNGMLLLTFLGLIGGALLKRWHQRQLNSPDQERLVQLGQVESQGLTEAEFYRRAAQYLHRYGGGNVPEAAATLLHKYEQLNFAGPQAGSGPVDPADRAEALAVLKQLKPVAVASPVSRPLVSALFLVLVAGVAQAADTDAQGRYQEVAQALEKQDYKAAQNKGEALVKSGQISPEVFTLLGHAAYKQGDPGGAVMWYQRAQLFPTAIPELRQNLRHLSEKVHYFGFRRNEWLDALVLIASRNQWALVATVGGWLAVFSLAFLMLGARQRLRTWVVGTLVIGLLGLSIGLFAWWLRPDFRSLENLAFVTASDAWAHTAAAEISGHVIAIPSGSTVRRIEERGAWAYVEIPQQDENVFGWLLAKDLVPVWPYDPRVLP